MVESVAPTATSPGVHNLITCTLCSCYPLSLLGLSPKWYKSRSFRARAVREPRSMLRDSFGLDLHQGEVRVGISVCVSVCVGVCVGLARKSKLPVGPSKCTPKQAPA